MSTLTADPKFSRGQVLGLLWKAYDADVGDGLKVIGSRSLFLDESPITKKKLSNRTVECVAVKNTSGAALVPGSVVKFRAHDGAATTPEDAGLAYIGGVAASTDVLVGVVDEYLSANVPVDEVCWVVVSGPAAVSKVTGTAILANGSVNISATTAGSATAGGAGTQVGYAIKPAASADTSVRVQVATIIRG
jgi:hypothetical protein